MNNSSRRDEIESAIFEMVEKFLKMPFLFFNEAEAVAYLYNLLRGKSTFSGNARTQDGCEISLVHREYPIPPWEYPIPPFNKRGKYDIVILKPDFAKADKSEIIARPGGKDRMPNSKVAKPFLAIIEVKLHYESLGGKRIDGAKKALNRLEGGKDHSDLAYFVCLQRYLKEDLKQWEKGWDHVEREADSKRSVNTIVAVHWKENLGQPKIYPFGHRQWLKKWRTT